MMIELLMTVALAMYFLAYYIIKKTSLHWFVHVAIALVAFAFDAYGTYLMTTMASSAYSYAMIIHTTLTVAALSLFFIQGGLGLLTYYYPKYKRINFKKEHAFFARTIFLPMWVVSFFSGFVFFIPGLT